MDHLQVEEEKLNSIRQTIREIILPLVQAIYIEDPPDITSFCAQYFEALQKGGSESKTAVKKTFDSDVDKCVPECSGKLEQIGTSRSSIQGSASLPILAGEKTSEALSLRETSSWNEPSNNLQGDQLHQNMECNVADAMSQIGDQASPVIAKEEVSEIHEKAGDAPTIMKNEEKSQNENPSKNENANIVNDTTEHEKKSCKMTAVPVLNSESEISLRFTNLSLEPQTGVIPSAPPYEECSTTTELPEKEFTAQQKKENFGKDDKFADEDSHFIIEGNTSGDAFMTKQNNICHGQLSPNSSFGFIPHLKEYESGEEINKSDDFTNKSIEEVANLTKKFSETFQDIAQELNTAESNLNSEFLKVNEISDIIQIQDETNTSPEAGSSEGSKMISGDDKNDRNCYNDEMNLDKKDMNEAILVDVIDEGNNMKSEIPNGGINFTHSIESATSDAKEVNDYNILEDIKDSVNKICDTVSKDAESSVKYDVENKAIDSHPERAQTQTDPANQTVPANQTDPAKSDPILLKNRAKDEDSRPRSYESWREKWYESHPRLTDVSERFQHKTAKLFRAYPSFTGNRRNQMIHRIGEAGDVPPVRRFQTIDRSSSKTVDYSSESSMNASSLTSEVIGSVSADAIQQRMNRRRVGQNNSDKNFIQKNSSPVSSQVYSWRKMNIKQQVTQSESTEPSSKMPRLIPEQDSFHDQRSYERNSSENLPNSDVHEGLNEIIVVKESVCEDNSNTLQENRTLSQSELNTAQPFSEGTNDTAKEVVEGNNEDSPLRFIYTEEEYSEECSLNNLISYDKENGNMSNCCCAKEMIKSVDTDEKNGVKPSGIARDSTEVSANQDNTIEKHDDYINQTGSTNCFQDDLLEKNKETEIEENKILTEKSDSKNESQNIDSCSKAEPGLISACGDFALTNVSDDIENDYEPEPRNSESTDDVSMNSLLSSQNFSNFNEQGITAEYFREVIQNVMQGRKNVMNDDYEGLNFSSISESESSNMEDNSDLSENDDPNMSSKMH